MVASPIVADGPGFIAGFLPALLRVHVGHRMSGPVEAAAPLSVQPCHETEPGPFTRPSPGGRTIARHGRAPLTAVPGLAVVDPPTRSPLPSWVPVKPAWSSRDSGQVEARVC